MKRTFRPAIIFSLLFSITITVAAQHTKSIEQAGVWKDINGNVINAHGAGILYYNGTYYMFGEIKSGKTWLVPGQSWEDYRVDAGGISCYSSQDLLNWKYEGVALAPNITDSTSDIHISKVIERPKVVYNEQTKQFVMWMHIDKNDYSYAHAGVAVSNTPAGPYKYIESIRPDGSMSRDMTVFKDEDGQAYLIYSSENNMTMHISQLSGDYLKPADNYKRILVGLNREAPAMFKSQGKYYLITSGCTGWSPNPASYAVADSPLGEWKQYDNPCTGKGAETTYGAQSTFVVPVEGRQNTFIFMADRWNKTDLPNSRYVWLPMHITEQGKPVIEWKDHWNLKDF